jgi:hypothetical protein
MIGRTLAPIHVGLRRRKGNGLHRVQNYRDILQFQYAYSECRCVHMHRTATRLVYNDHALSAFLLPYNNHLLSLQRNDNER